MGKDDEDSADRDAILRRRSRFVAIALSGITTAVGPACDDTTDDTVEQVEELMQQVSPQACLEQSVVMTPIVDDASAQLVEPDAGPPDAGPPDAGVRPRPRVCLRVVRPRPRPCLSPRRMVDPQVCLMVYKPGDAEEDDSDVEG